MYTYIEKEFVIQKQRGKTQIIDCTTGLYFGGFDSFKMKVSNALPDGKIVDLFRRDIAYRVRKSKDDFTLEVIDFIDPLYSAENIDYGLIKIKDSKYEFDATDETKRKMYQIKWNEEALKYVQDNGVEKNYFYALRDSMGSIKAALFFVDLMVRGINPEKVKRMIDRCKSTKDWSHMVVILGAWSSRYLPEPHNMKNLEKFDHYIMPIQEGYDAYLTYYNEKNPKEEQSA